tara:strand:- start:44 stop:460 length:417 start_codon:yes stop_codon:yes gene_type:complete
MAVPDTTTFTLQDVVTEINPTTDDLSDCFADATAACFDSSYSGTKTELLNFRNYGASCTTSYSSSGGVKPSIACSATINLTYYHNGSGTYPVSGDNCYSNSAGTTVLATGTYKMADASLSGSKYVIGSSGNVTSVTAC